MRRIVTRPDFDGVVCAVLLKEALEGEPPIIWTQPNEMQRGQLPTYADDVIANLPFHAPAALWFDHHVSNAIDQPFKGLFRVVPSAAGLVHEFFRDTLDGRFLELVRQADRIDSAQLTLDEILHPERYPYVLLSMTIFIRQPSDTAYCNHLVELLRSGTAARALADPLVRQKCQQVVKANQSYEVSLKQYTTVQGHVSITDFRNLKPPPEGNRFLVYSLFPQAVVNMKVYDEDPYVVVKLGHSILNPGCRINVGKLLSNYGGGGHRGAGACRFERDRAEQSIIEIIHALKENKPNE